MRPLLDDLLRHIDEARNASPRTPQQPSDMVREHNERLAGQAEKIQALRRARESGTLIPLGKAMARKRELIDTGSDKQYVRRNKSGQFNEVDDVERSLAADRRRRAKTKAKPGEGTDTARPKRKAASKARKKQLVGKAPLGSLPVGKSRAKK